MIAALLVALALGGPWEDAADVDARVAQEPALHGGPADPCHGPAGPLREVCREGGLAGSLGGSLVAGSWTEPLRAGDAEAGLLSARLRALGAARTGVFEAHLGLRAGGDVAPGSAQLFADTWRVGIRHGGLAVALSQEDRWVGPGRRGSLVLTDHALPLPGGEVSGTWAWPWGLGHSSAWLGMGWIPERRRGPDFPGWLLVDLRWAPRPWVELGLSRRSVYGGWEDGTLRPVDVGQLLLPTRPHVEGDPDREEADTDEGAALDLRLSLPLAAWVGGPVDLVELAVQHGGEDVIARKLGPVPYPSLAGVGNLYRLEVVVGDWSGAVERAVLEDDLFRWYTGHRVYHDSWTLRGMSLGHPWGGDMRTWSVGVAHRGVWMAGLRVEQVHRVLVLDRVDDEVFTALTAEERVAVTGHVGHVAGARRWWAEVTAARVAGEDFVPGADGWQWRLAVHADGATAGSTGAAPSR